MNTTIIVVIIQILYQSTLEFPKCERQPLLYPLEKPRITLLVQMVVIVFKHSVNILLVFLNVRGSLSCILLEDLE